jgi:hypothetical protein
MGSNGMRRKFFNETSFSWSIFDGDDFEESLVTSFEVPTNLWNNLGNQL